MYIRNAFWAIAFVSSFAAVSNASSIIPQAIAIPDSEVVLNFNNTGLDWVYAGPVSPDEWGPGQIEQVSYRASEGWRNATASEWATKPSWTDFIKAPYDPGTANGFNHFTYKYTSEYWSNFTHVDLGNAADGRITNGTDIGSLNDAYETWYVRDSAVVAVVPLPPSGYAGLALILLMGLACHLRERRCAGW